MPTGTPDSLDPTTLDTAVKGLAVLSAIPVVLYALWTDYFGRFIEEKLKEDPKLDLAPEVTRIRVAGFFAFLSQFMLFVGTGDIRRAYPIACNLLFVTALAVQMWIQSSAERKLAPKLPEGAAKPRDPFLLAFRAFIWSTVGGLFYVGLLILSLRTAVWVSGALQLTPNASAALLAAGAAIGVLGGLGLGFALGPFQMRRMFPTTAVSDPELSQEIEGWFRQNGLKPPSLWIIGTDEVTFANAMIAGFRSGRGLFRPALFISKGLLQGLDRAELRAVIFHEISHLRLQHLRKRMVFSSGLIMATSIVAGFAILAVNLLVPGGPFNWIVGFGMLVGAFLLTLRSLTRQNRFHEIEADIHSVRLGAGIDHLSSALRKLDRINNPSPGSTAHNTRMLAGTGHPLTEERIKILRAYFERHPTQVGAGPAEAAEEKKAA